jgi:hypothetical protein
VAAAIGAFQACGSDADLPPKQDAGANDVSTEGGGTGGTGGGGSGGTGGGADADANDCLAGAITVDPALFALCPGCTDARCVDTTLVEPMVPASQLAQLADCNSGAGKCVPDKFLVTGGKFIVETCHSLLGAEGRCLSKCLGAVASQADRLPQDTCDTDEVCAPCWDPVTGESTSACNISCDTGPTEEKKVFASCCSNLGVCVPTGVVPTAQASLLGVDTCTGGDFLCAPSALVDPAAKPPTCTSVGDSEGRCVPDCLPSVQGVKDFLPVDTCQTGEICAPCYDPRTGDETGACSINGDSPTQQAYTFPKCCAADGGATSGTCVPAAAVPSVFSGFLSQDTCPDPTTLCAPDVKVTDLSAKFPSCISAACVDGSCYPGACVPLCFIPEQYRGLPQTSCNPGEACAPCENPLADNSSTGACD